MVFSSVIFLCAFLPLTVIAYNLSKNLVYKNTVLVLLSLLFYAWGEPKYVLILMFSICVNYFLAYGIHKQNAKSGGVLRKLLLVVSVVFNCGILFFFKYYNFTVETLNSVLGLLNIGGLLDVVSIVMPIGISFFTFQILSYVIDVYRDDSLYQNNIFDLALYICLFPQLIAGPIVRYQEINKQISNRTVAVNDCVYGIERFIIGLSKKVLIANTVATVADYSFELIEKGNIGIKTAWFGALCYALQIYFDFSGYSDMAIGLCRMFGFRINENFNYPYAATSVTDFWRRWHISLSSWFRDYVYIPLGGNRVTPLKHIRNLFIVWLLTGIWHGANWTFIVWGLAFFVILMIEKYSHILDLIKKSRLLSVFTWILTFIVVTLLWVVFRADSISQALEYFKCMFTAQSAATIKDAQYVTNRYLLFAGFSFFISLPAIKIVLNKIRGSVSGGARVILVVAKYIVLLILLLLSLATVVSTTYNPFIYFNF